MGQHAGFDALEPVALDEYTYAVIEVHPFAFAVVDIAINDPKVSAATRDDATQFAINERDVIAAMQFDRGHGTDYSAIDCEPALPTQHNRFIGFNGSWIGI